MSQPGRYSSGVSTVLRGDSLHERRDAAPQLPPHPAAGACATADAAQSAKTINGVPMSAAKHCCGRGCQHCRIYWRKSGA